LTRKTKAVLPVHLTGQVCKIKEIMKIAKINNLAVIEDCAHAIGSKLDGKHVGTFGDSGCFSFYPTKNITTIEGGMIVTNSKRIAQYANAARNHGITKSLLQRYSHGRPWEYDVVEPGYNYRLDEIRSSLGTSQLGMIAKWNLLRKKAFEYYNKKLSKIDGLITPVVAKNTQHSYHLYILRIQEKFGLSRDGVYKKLLTAGVRTSVHYKPLHEFTIFKKKAKHMVDLKNTKKLYKEILSLPLFPHITKHEQDHVINCLMKPDHIF
jgi:dTDP-4-amino-4,6-dideoxygalactose transaminase